MSQKITRQSIRTSEAPAAIGPYSQAVRSGDLLFLSGQIPLDPSSGQLVDGSVADETRRVMENLRAVLNAAGCNFEHVVKTTIYLMDMADFTQVNEVYATYFDKEPPARATVQVAGLPKGVRVEIDAIARVTAD
ncbi:MAG: RidA family protein [Polyangiaceae bacterium]